MTPRHTLFAVLAFLPLSLHLTAQPLVRAAYLIPNNRTAQPNAVPLIRQVLTSWQAWLCDRSDRALAERRRLRLETEADGVTPRVHVAYLAVTDRAMHADPWTEVNRAATNAGITVWARGEVWLLIPEMHIMQPDGSILGGVALGGSYGSGDDPGVAMIYSAGLAMLQRGSLTDTRPYAGMVIPEVGPYPLVQDVSFPWFEGNTLSSVISSFYGAGLHELMHALGLPHDWRNDDNFNGNLMFNGLRGFRGAVFPELFPGDETRLEYASALQLRACRYLTLCDPSWPSNVSSDTQAPQVAVLTQGTVSPVNGLLEISVTAADDQDLACLILDRAGDRIGEWEIAGRSVSMVLRTPFYAVQTPTEFGVAAVDRRGNRLRVASTITVAAVGNRAPQPDLRVTPPAAPAGTSVQLDGSRSLDPESGSLLYEWDLDGDGSFDTLPSSNPRHQTSWNEPWPRLVYLRVTDNVGNRSVSTALPFRSQPAAESADHAPYGDGTPGCLGLLHLRANRAPAVGTAAFGLATTHAPRATVGALGLALRTVPSCLSVGGACLLLDPATVLLAIPVSSDARGNAWLPLPIPGNVTLRGFSFAVQSWWAENGGCQIPAPGLATSNGLFVRVQ